ncbi:MAG: FliM/FliN family flagellar motor switch protein [Acidobacteria bacterium]|jgi:type III secretion protein Q|nr:FliM/FliN family flagellar motor switch protein [Acidobacteriota bacterium]
MAGTRDGRSGGTPDAGLLRPELAALPIALSARIATGRARLAALRELAPGQLVPLTTPVGEPCRLLADGAVIGAGEVVEVRGQLALRLTRLGQDRG